MSQEQDVHPVRVELIFDATSRVLVGWRIDGKAYMPRIVYPEGLIESGELDVDSFAFDIWLDRAAEDQSQPST